MTTPDTIANYVFNGIQTKPSMHQHTTFVSWYDRISHDCLKYDVSRGVWHSPLLGEFQFGRILGAGTSGVVVEAGPYAVKIMPFEPATSLQFPQNQPHQTMEYAQAAFAGHIGVGPSVFSVGHIAFPDEGMRRGFIGDLLDYRRVRQLSEWPLYPTMIYYYICMERWDTTLYRLTREDDSGFARMLWQLPVSPLLDLLRKIRHLNEHGLIHFDIVLQNILVRFRANSTHTLANVVELCLVDFSYASDDSEFSFLRSSKGVDDLLSYYSRLPDTRSHVRSLMMHLKLDYEQFEAWLRNDPVNFDRIFALRVFELLPALRPPGTHFPNDYVTFLPPVPEDAPVDELGYMQVDVYLDDRYVVPLLLFVRSLLVEVRKKLKNMCTADFRFRISEPEIEMLVDPTQEASTLLFEIVDIPDNAVICRMDLQSTTLN